MNHEHSSHLFGSLLRAGLRALLPASLRSAWREFRSGFSESIPRNTVRIYGDPRLEGFRNVSDCSVEDLPAGEERRHLWQSEKGLKILCDTSLLCTCLNEEGSVESWLNSLFHQEVLPAEVVIVDGGSTDGTLSRLQLLVTAWESAQPLPRCRFVLHQDPGANIARGRNVAAEKASGSIFLFADMGCCYDPAWASCLLYPFLHSATTEVSMGWYQVSCRSRFFKAVARYIVPQSERMDLPIFLPSARSLALRRESFERAGKFPEFLTRAGEDSLFDLELKKTAQQFAFLPQPLVSWSMPSSWWRLWRMIVGYAQGDAEGGKLAMIHYWTLLKQVSALLFLVVLTLGFATVYIFSKQESKSVELGVFALAVAAASLSMRQAVNLLLPYQAAGNHRLLHEQLRGIFAALFVVSAQCCGFVKGFLKRFFS